jgi:indolepyruvate decarboxylase
VRVGEAVYNNVEMKDILAALTAKVSRKDVRLFKTPGIGKPIGAAGDKITPEYLYGRWEQMLKEGDILVAETGTGSMGMGLPICRKDRHSIIKRRGARSAGQRRHRSVRPWRRLTGA